MPSDLYWLSRKVAIKPSPRLAVLLLISHTIAAAMLYLTAIPLPARLALFLLVSLSLLYHLARDVLLLLPDSWREVALVPGGQTIATRDGSRLSFRIANQTIVSPYFVVLAVRLEGHRLLAYRVVFPDALETGIFRELCVRLKFA